MNTLEKRGKFVAEEIARTFKNKSYKLKFVERSHFMVRLYRTTKNEDFLNSVVERFLIEKEEIMKDFDNLNNKKYIKKKSIELFEELKRKKRIKQLKRIKLFKSRREFLFYYHIMQHLYFWKIFNISNTRLKKHYLNGLRFLKKFKKDKDFDKFFFDENMIRYFGTQIVNCVYYLKYLDIVNIEKKFMKRFRDVFNDEKDKNLPDYLYKNKIYGLTHFIIAGTNYYQRYSSKREFDWILNYFKKNIKIILKKTDPDIASEVGLSFKLCRYLPKEELNLIRKYVIKRFRKKLGYIPRFKGGMNPSEHTASVAYLFLSNFRKLYEGPNIKEEINKNL